MHLVVTPYPENDGGRTGASEGGPHSTGLAGDVDGELPRLVGVEFRESVHVLGVQCH